MPSVIYPWPYAARAAIQYIYLDPGLELFVIFPFPMDQTVKPAHGLWICRVGILFKDITASTWMDAYTLRLTVPDVFAAPTRVRLKYDGPDSNLQTTWGKDWEPWGLIDCFFCPPHFTTTLTAGIYPGWPVSGIHIIFLDTAAGAILIQGLSKGVNGQVIHIARIDALGNNTTLAHDNLFGIQKLFLHAMVNEILNGEYGGWALVCDGSNWFDISHAKHV